MNRLKARWTYDLHQDIKVMFDDLQNSEEFQEFLARQADEAIIYQLELMGYEVIKN